MTNVAIVTGGSRGIGRAAALKLGATLATLTEAVQIAAAIRGGAALVTGIQMVDQVAAATMGMDPRATTIMGNRCTHRRLTAQRGRGSES